MHNKIIVTKYKQNIVCGLADERFRFLEINFEEEHESSVLGNIYVGKVQNIVKGIHAAFIEFGENKTGYYNMEENKNPFILNRKNVKQLNIGDQLIVQVSRDAVKTKDPVLTSNIELPGKSVILTLNNSGTVFSKKFTGEARKKTLRESFSSLDEKDYGLIIRTNANAATDDEIQKEAALLDWKWKEIKDTALYRTSGSILYSSLQTYLSYIRDAISWEVEEIMTDDRELYGSIKTYLEELQEGLDKLTFYQDDFLPLTKLYDLEKCMEEVLKEKIWLKSGAYLVIQPTEALVVIDVNSGKISPSKKAKNQFLKINLEAAKEIAYQLRFRNLSGIIIVDFINMKEENQKEELLKELEQYLKADRIRTSLIEMTKLELVEITRKKVRKPVYEQLRYILKPRNLS